MSPANRRARFCFATALVGALASLSVSACTSTEEDRAGPEHSAASPRDTRSTGTYVGPNGARFKAWIKTHDNSIATVIGPVGEVFNSHAFTLKGGDGSRDLLVVGTGRVTNLRSGDRVAVTGPVHQAFDLAVVQDKLGIEFASDTALRGFAGDPYVQATNTALEN